MIEPSVTMAEAEQRTEECLAFLRTLVETESPTGDEAGNLTMARLLEEAIVGAGGEVQRIPASGLGVHLLSRFPGTRRDKGPILVMGHMDTVHPVGTLKRLPFEVAGGRVWGPGIYDMKSGLAVSLFALRMLAEMKSGPGSDVTLLITCDEEIGSSNSRDRIEAEARAARATLVVEPSAPGGAVKSRRKGVSAYVLDVEGQPSHAGIEPEAGASAIHEISRQICRIYEVADVKVGTTVSVGVVEGGIAENVVAPSARCTIDVRFWTSAEAERVDSALRGAEPFNGRCTLRLKGGINRGPLEKSQASAKMLAHARALAERLGFEIGDKATGGGSDGNITASVGCPTLDGLGPDGGGAHTLKENILLSEVPRRVGLMAALFETL